MIYNRTSVDEPTGQFELYTQAKLNLTGTEFVNLEVVRKLRMTRVRETENGDVPGVKNNFIWRQSKKAMKSGFLIVLLGLDKSQLQPINSELTKLTKCYDEELCTQNGRCLLKYSPGLGDTCQPYYHQWSQKFRCCGDSVSDVNPLCAFNQTVQVVTLPSLYSTISERYYHYRRPGLGQPIKDNKSGVFIFNIKHDQVKSFDYTTKSNFRAELESTLLRHGCVIFFVVP